MWATGALSWALDIRWAGSGPLPSYTFLGDEKSRGPRGHVPSGEHILPSLLDYPLGNSLKGFRACITLPSKVSKILHGSEMEDKVFT